MKKGSKATKPYAKRGYNRMEDEPGFNENDIKHLAPSMRKRVLRAEDKPNMTIEECREVFWRLAEKRQISPFVKLYIEKLEAKIDEMRT
jgi:hypothetical protein